MDPTRNQSAARSCEAFGSWPRKCLPASRLGWQCHRLVAHAEIQRKVRARTPIVLSVESEECLVHINWSCCRWIVQVDAVWYVGEKILQRAEIELSIWRHPSRELRVLHVLHGKPEFQRVGAASNEGIVIELEG